MLNAVACILVMSNIRQSSWFGNNVISIMHATFIHRKLEGVCNFSKYTNLKYLWLSNNRVSESIYHICYLFFTINIHKQLSVRRSDKNT